jgi:hypothetical protein
LRCQGSLYRRQRGAGVLAQVKEVTDSAKVDRLADRDLGAEYRVHGLSVQSRDYGIRIDIDKVNHVMTRREFSDVDVVQVPGPENAKRRGWTSPRHVGRRAGDCGHDVRSMRGVSLP